MSRDSREIDASRVLYVIKTVNRGGAESLVKELVGNLAGPRRHITVAHVLPADDEFIAEMDMSNVALADLGERGWRWPLRMASLVWSGRYDIVHVHSPLPGSVARIAVRMMSKSRRPAVITTEHNSWRSFHPLTRIINRWTIRWDTAVVAVSEDARQSMSPKLRRETVTLTHGINTSDVASQLSRVESFAGEISANAAVSVICSVANLRPAKDHINLLNALLLVKMHGLPFICVLVGHGPEEDNIRRMIAEMTLDQHVVMLGVRDDVFRIIAASDVLVLSSRIEGLPVVLMEAVTVGTPIVATAVGGIPEHFADGVNALLVPPGDPRRLADAIIRVLEDPELGGRLAEVASRLTETFDSRRSARFYDDLYRRAERRA